jgi:hypothetical protein
MRDHILSILRDVRTAKDRLQGFDATHLLEEIETNAMAALQGDKCIVPSKLFGDIVIPKGVITEMSNGYVDLWFKHGSYLDVNVFYDTKWLFIIYPVKNGDTNTEHLLESGKL